MPPSPPPADLPPPQAGLPPALGSVSIGSVLAALAELNVKVSIEDLLKAIHDQERARITAQLRAVSLQRELAQAPCSLSDDELVQCSQSLSNELGQPSTPIHPQPPTSTPSLPSPPMTTRPRLDIVVFVFLNLPKRTPSVAR